jgi:hypothetical protein
MTNFITQYCIEYISPLAGLVVIDDIIDTMLCDKVCQWSITTNPANGEMYSLTISGISGDRPLTNFITQYCIEYISPLAGLVVIDH